MMPPIKIGPASRYLPLFWKLWDEKVVSGRRSPMTRLEAIAIEEFAEWLDEILKSKQEESSSNSVSSCN